MKVMLKSRVEKKMYTPSAYHPYLFMRNFSFWVRVASSGNGVSDEDDEEGEGGGEVEND